MSATVALADVLAALTTCNDAEAWRSAKGSRGGPLLSPDGSGAILRPVAWQATLYPWAHTSPAEALEALHTRAMWPFVVEGAGAVRWRALGRCGMCGGRGGASGDCPRCNDRGMAVTSVPTAPTISALVAVASLGASALLRAASLAEDIARAAGYPKARLVWRVMTRAAIEERHRKAFDDGAAAGVEYVAASTAGLHRADIGELLAWVDETKGDRAVAERVIALALHEDGTATGVHLVGLDAGAVTLAVEALS